MGANRFLAVPSPHGRLVLRAWLAAERDAARAVANLPRAGTAEPAAAASRLPQRASHPLPSPHFRPASAPLVGTARKFAAASKARRRLGSSER